jgi:EmrB/QacA subfamily drug resistance transporter
MTNARETRSPRSTRRAALIAATLTAFLTPFMDSATNVALPEIRTEFAMGAVELTWIRVAYLLAAAMFLVPFGKIADIYGRKRIYTYGTSIFTFAALLIGLSQSGEMLIGVRAFQGIGSAMIFGTGVAILTSVFEPGERGRILGINVAAVYIGLSLGPFVGGVLTDALGWRSIFFVTVGLGIVALAFVLWRLEGEWAEARGERFDLTGSAIYGVSLALLMVGISRLPDPLGIGFVVVGTIGLGAFAAWEVRETHPVLNIDLLLENRPFAFSNVAALINYSATSAVAFLMSLYLREIQGLEGTEAGLVLLAQPVVQAALSPVAGRLSDRVEPRIIASAGMGFTALGLGLFAFIGPNTPIWTIVARLAILGFGFALFSSPNMNAIMGSVARRFYGVASGMLGTMRLIGQTFSQAIVTLLFALYIGPVEIAPENYAEFLTSSRVAFVVFGALCVIGIFASLTRGKIREEGGS